VGLLPKNRDASEACLQTYNVPESGAGSIASHPCKERKDGAPPSGKGADKKQR
jgi:hypothetical protein